jgi:predicted dehydrogenase
MGPGCRIDRIARSSPLSDAAGALAAGKDAYLEKPMSPIEQSRQMVEAVRKAKQIVRSGCSAAALRRSSKPELVDSGVIGKITMVKPNGTGTSRRAWITRPAGSWTGSGFWGCQGSRSGPMRFRAGILLGLFG